MSDRETLPPPSSTPVEVDILAAIHALETRINARLDALFGEVELLRRDLGLTAHEGQRTARRVTDLEEVEARRLHLVTPGAE